MSSEAQLADLFITLRAVNAPMLRGFAETATAGEEMVAALDGALARFDAAATGAAERLAALKAEMRSAGTSVVAPAVAASTAPVGAGEDVAAAEAVAKAEREVGVAAEEEAAAVTGAQVRMRDELGRFVGANETGAEAIRRSYQKIIAEHAAMQAELRASLGPMTAALTAETDAFAAEEAKAAAAGKTFAASMDDSALRAKEAATKYGMVAAAAAVVAGATVKAAGDYEQSTNRLVTSAGESATAVVDSSGKTVGGIDMVRQGMLKMAGEVGVSASDLSKAMYVVESAGYHGAAGLGVLRNAEQGAKAEGADATTVTDALSSAMRDYYPKAKSAGEVTAASADVMSKFIGATSAGKMTFDQLASSLHSVLPAASVANVSLSDVLGSLAAMTVHGMSADQATQNLAHAIGHLQTVIAPQGKELALLGLDARQLSDDLGTKGLSGTMQEIAMAIQQNMGPDSTRVILDLQTALAKLPPQVQELGKAALDGTITWGDYTKATKALGVEAAGQASSFATLAKSTHAIGQSQVDGATVMQTYSQALKSATGDQTGLNVALMLTGQNADYANSAVSQVAASSADAAGNVRGWAEIQGTFNQKVSEAKAGLGALVIQIGNYLLPVASRIASVFATVSQAFANNKGLAAALAAVIGGVLVVSLGAMITKLAAVAKGAFTTLGQISLLIAAVQFGLGHLNSFAGVATLVVTALIGIGVAAKLLAAPWSQMLGAFATARASLVTWVSEIGAAEGAMATMKTVGSGVVSFLGGPWGVAIGVAVAALAMFATNSNDSTTAQNDLTTALQASNGALDDNAQKVIYQQLQQKGAVDAAKTLGINLADLTQAAMGNTAAMDSVNAAYARVQTAFHNGASASADDRDKIAGQELALHKLQDALPGVIANVHGAVQAFNDQKAAGIGAADATKTAGQAAASAASPAQTLATAQDNLATGLDAVSAAQSQMAGGSSAVTDAIKSLDDATKILTDQLDLLNGRNINGEQALLHVRDAADKMTKSFHDNGRSLDENTSKGRANMSAILDAVDAANKHYEAVHKQTGSVTEATDAFNNDVKALQALWAQAGLTKDQIKTLTDLYLNVPKDVTTNFNTPGLGAAMANTQRYIDQTGRAHSTGRAYATGGRVAFGPGGRVAGPGTDTSDSIDARLSADEFVVKARSARPVYPVLDALNSGNLGQAYSLLGAIAGGGGGGAVSTAAPPAAAPSGGAMTVVNLQVFVQGNVTTEKDLIRSIQQGILRLSGRNTGFGTNVAFS